MTTITIADVLRNIDRQLEWRGPSGKEQGVITMQRAEAEYLRNWCILLCKERDDLVFQLDVIEGRVRVSTSTEGGRGGSV